MPSLLSRIFSSSLVVGGLMFAAACAPGPLDDVAESSGAIAAGDHAKAAAAVSRTRGYRALPAAQKGAIDRLLEGKTNVYSKAARRDLLALVEDDSFSSASAEEQAAQIWAVVHVETDFASERENGLFTVGAWPKYAQVIQPTVAAGASARLGSATVGDHVGMAAPKDGAQYAKKLTNLLSEAPTNDTITEADFDLTPERVALFPVKIGGEELTIAAPLVNGRAPARDALGRYAPESGGSEPLINYSVETVAQALADLPPANRRLITGAVSITSARNPVDAIFNRLQGRTDLRAVMAAAVFPEGNLGLFALPESQIGELQLDSLVHETGHLWSYSRWGLDPNGAGWKAWKAAIAADAIAPSWYAGRNMIEDAAESVLLYCALQSAGAKSRVLSAEMAALFPNRWKILEKEFPGR